MKCFAVVALLAAPLVLGFADSGYQAPASGDVARIEFINEMGSEARVLLYQDAKDCRNRSTLKPVLASGARSDTTVATDRDLAFTMDMQNAVVYCISTRSFRPVAGKTYVMHFQETPNGCTIVGWEDQRPVALINRKWTRSWDESGSFCTPLK